MNIQRANLPPAVQNINTTTNNTQADIIALTNEEVILTQNLENRKQDLINDKELLRLNGELQKITRTLIQQQISIPKDVGLTIGNTVIAQTKIDTLKKTKNTITQIDKEIQQIDDLEDNLQNLRDRYQENIDTLNALLPLQKLKE